MNTSVVFEYDPYRLIEEVKKRPSLWNNEDKEYRRNVRSRKVWKEIVTELLGSDVNISKRDMKDLELELQKKWKGMRDTFRKYSANPTKTKRPYIYSKQLRFLLKDKSDDFPLNDTSSESDESRNIRLCRAKIKFKFNKAGNSFEDGYDTRSNDTFDASDIIKDVPQNTGNPYTRRPAMDKFVFTNVDTHSKNDNFDPDKMFLLSLLPHLKAVPEQYRLNVKMDLMEALRSASFL